ncbi:FtsX-like permease family protein [Flavihumibacter petaseus]|uniref:Putative ABC transporter permease protein n=1 Tax=Flavihumibacter petaseus NBRC 106054 TaxID=1220578 RepID=A0A0E9MX91_9BACT|nr:FtsX-like permease family protein [Flavihumibacter petaseus]GAO41740.1 putative ABC transporter permease protein [Flavihumibacter petaseus NBRC 106054]
MNFLFAWRYFKSKKSTNAINIIAWVSVAAIIVGTASLIVVLSVFNGFEDLVKSLYASFYTDLKIVPAKGKTISLTPEQLKQIAAVPGVKSFSRVAEEKALLQNGEVQTIVFLKGVDSSYTQVTTVDKAVKVGEFNLGDADKPAAVLGVGIENALGLWSDRELLPLTVYMPRRGASMNLADPMQSLRAENIYTAGAFAIQQDFDNQYVLTNLDFIKRLLDLKQDEYGGLEIALRNPDDGAAIQKQLSALMGGNYKVLSRYEQNQSLYSIMTLEKWVIYGLLSLILVVAAFTMIGSLTMLILEKQKDIQVLKALGATNGRIQSIFIGEGFLLAGIGALSGSLLAILIGWLQVKYKLVALEGSSFVIDYYPVKFLVKDFILVWGTVCLVAFLASWFPARKAASEQVMLKSQ